MTGPRGGRPARGARVSAAWVIVAVGLFAGFAALGTWQLQRLAWKRHLIAAVEARTDAPAVAAPGPAQWEGIGSGDARYRHVRVTGHYLHDAETLVHGTSRLGYGYWVMTPLRTGRGFTVLVNRGHIPESLPGTPAFRTMPRPEGRVTVGGLLRLSKPGGDVFRANAPAKGAWYSRDVAAIATAAGLPADRVAPYFIDAGERPGPQGWPAGGLTVVDFPNHHLSYAITWYAMALAAPAAVLLALRRRHPQEKEWPNT
ncbi:hypothetical protein KBTX_00174 [wastewater metagenome]|uniref:SURF1-like protein n=3 Tax=root TaxID=1 RepID=A0A5B8R8T9_9ZZZZ|nr:SURF1 family protein [Arhodomonas aquaeolei]QEA03874.1 hypothetical protein KBTEX_00174 [uncultured organism]